MIRILVVDDHRLVRAAIRRLLAEVRGIDIAGEAESGEDALTLTRTLRPNVVLMDIRMPGIGGLEATRRIVRMEQGARVLMLTACDSDPFPAQALRAGAAGYLTKGCTADELEAAIRKVFVGQRYVANPIAQHLALKAFDDAPACPFEALSNREMQITMMVVNCHRVQEISTNLHLSPKTVNSYRYRIFEKLHVTSDVELALLAARHGMIDLPRGQDAG